MKALIKLSLILILSASLIGCKRSIETPSASFVYTFVDYNNYSTEVNGEYRKDQALDSSNYVVVYLYVNQLGSYNISTNTYCGISFAGSGTFTTLGRNSVYLWGKGTPDSIINSANFNILGVNGNDQNNNTQFYFDILTNIFINYTETDSDGYYSVFKFYGSNHTCFANYYFDTTIQRNTLNIEDSLCSYYSDTAYFALHIANDDGSPIKPGSYTSIGMAGSDGYSMSVLQYYKTPIHINPAQPSGFHIISLISKPNLPFTVNINSINGTNIKGTFSGTLVNSIDSADKFNITNGIINL